MREVFQIIPELSVETHLPSGVKIPDEAQLPSA
jgi:hypothetical protein